MTLMLAIARGLMVAVQRGAAGVAEGALVVERELSAEHRRQGRAEREADRLRTTTVRDIERLPSSGGGSVTACRLCASRLARPPFDVCWFCLFGLSGRPPGGRGIKIPGPAELGPCASRRGTAASWTFFGGAPR